MIQLKEGTVGTSCLYPVSTAYELVLWLDLKVGPILWDWALNPVDCVRMELSFKVSLLLPKIGNRENSTYLVSEAKCVRKSNWVFPFPAGKLVWQWAIGSVTVVWCPTTKIKALVWEDIAGRTAREWNAGDSGPALCGSWRVRLFLWELDPHACKWD